MRRSAKRLLSLIFILALALGLAAPAYADGLSGSEALSFSFALVDPSDPDAAIPVTVADLAFTAELGGVSVADGGSGLTLADLMADDLVVTPPEGYRVVKLLLLGTETVDAEKPLYLLAGSPADPDTVRSVTVSSDSFSTYSQGSQVFNEALLSSSGSPFRLAVLFEALDTNADVTVSAELGGVIADPDPVTKPHGSSFTMPSLSEQQLADAAAAGKQFNGWLLQYRNGAVVYVSAGSEIYPYGDCTLYARWKPIATVTANSPVQNENGDYVANGFTVSGLDAEHRIDADGCTLTVSQSDAGYLVTPSAAQVLDGDDDDVTGLYALRYVASAAVAPSGGGSGENSGNGNNGGANGNGGGNRGNNGATALTVTAVTASVPYSGQEIQASSVSNDTFTNGYKVEGLAAGHSVSAVTVTGSGTNVGGYNTAVTAISITDGTNDVTADYSITYNPGTLTITQLPVTVTAVSGSKEYSGQAITAADVTADGFTNGYKAEGLVTGHSLSALTLKINNAASVTNAGSYATAASGAAVTDGTNDVTANYSFSYVPGTVTVSQRALTITAVTGHKEYTARPITAADVTADGFTNGYKVENLAAGHTLSAITVTVNNAESVTNVNSYTTAIASPSAIVVSDAANDVTANYSITAVDGTLTVDPRPLTVTAISGNVPATGSTIYAKNCDGNGYTNGYKAVGLLSDSDANGRSHVLSGDFVTGSGTEGEIITGIDRTKLEVKDADGHVVTGNYNITTVGGKITVVQQTQTKTPITVTASATKVYDAQPLTLKNSDLKLTSASPNLLPSGYTLEATFANISITNAQKVSVAISNVHVKDASGNDVTDQYAVTVVTGTMEITRKPLTLTAESASKTYDGTALVNKNVRSSPLASTSHKLSVEYEITNSEGKVIKTGAVNVGTYTKKITKATIMEGSTDVTANYAIQTVNGTLTINAGSTAKTSSRPATGDTNRLNLWAGILVVSAILALSLLLLILLRHRLHLRKPKKQNLPQNRTQNKQ